MFGPDKGPIRSQRVFEIQRGPEVLEARLTKMDSTTLLRSL